MRGHPRVFAIYFDISSHIVAAAIEERRVITIKT